MRLSLEEIRRITQGAVRVEEADGQFRFYRFTEEQERRYESYDPALYQKCYATAGIVLRFQTDSPRMRLQVTALKSTSRTYFAADVLRDGVFIGAVENFSGMDLSGDYTTHEFPLGTYNKTFDLGYGTKTVTVYLPWSVDLRLDGLTLEDGSFVLPAVRDKKLLVFGDSISQGYDALHPMDRYPVALAKRLGAEECNKAIGGEFFWPALAKMKDPFAPDYIAVAYGTNDWGWKTWTEFSENGRAFYQNLSSSYPDARIFALLPIWRRDMDEVRKCCPFRQVAETIREWAADLPNVTVIDCFDYVPHDPAYFADFRLHPNDRGFEHYGRNLAGFFAADT